MTALPGRRKRRRRINTPVIKGAADNDALNIRVSRFQRLYVLQGRNAAGCNHRYGRHIGQGRRRLYIDAGKRAIAADIGIDDRLESTKDGIATCASTPRTIRPG